MLDQHEIIKKLKLQPHPEGGWYRETYRAAEEIPAVGLPKRFHGPRNHATMIYFMLTSGTFSALHRLQSDEQWHFYAGNPLTIHVIHPDGRYAPISLGPELELGQTFQAVVTYNSWFGATVDAPQGFALVGCTVAPGFDFADFEMAERARLIKQFPQHQQLVERLTHI